MKKKSIFVFIALLFLSFSPKLDKTLSDFVNPFIGTGGHGHTYPGVCQPFGMVQLSPDTRLDGWDGCSGYHYSDNYIYGFTHTHLSGTGCSDYGDILLMPTPKLSFKNTEYGSKFKHQNEYAKAGYYSVVLDDAKVKVELTTSKRVGFHKYTFLVKGTDNVIIDLVHRDKVLASSIKKVNDSEIEGFRRSEAWATDQHVYFVARFSKPFKAFGIAEKDQLVNGITESKSNNIKAFVQFDVAKNEAVSVKVSISAVSIEGARLNLEKELPDWDFEKAKTNAENEWNKELGKITIDGTDKQKTIFYTALYHAMITPNLYMDVDGQYRGRDLKIHKAEKFDNYTVFSLWDTYRAEHPLFTIIDQKRTNDYIQTFLAQFEQASRLPVWELSGNETNCMIAYHSIPVIADAYLKGINNFDANLALKAMKNSADEDVYGLKTYKNFGYVLGESEHESVSKTLEYAYDDWCIALMSKAVGRQDDYRRFIERAQFYKNVFDTETKFMRAKINSAWYTPFDAKEVNFNYTEANSWQYSFLVPQDIENMIKMYGGKSGFDKKLDLLFSESSKTTGREQVDITGLIGQYAHGNEPSHHIAYLYNYVGKPFKTQQLVKNIMQTMYTDQPDGIIGNDDCGQTSAWFIFSSLGFYPVTPCAGYYAIGSPMHKKAEINLENGNKFTVTANNVSDRNIYIQSATFNGKPYSKAYIMHNDIMKGGTLNFEMGDKPSNWGTGNNDMIIPSITETPLLAMPYVTKGEKTFENSRQIELKAPIEGSKIYYTFDGSEPDANSNLYTKSFEISQTTVLKAFAKKDAFVDSYIMNAKFTKVHKVGKIKLLTKYTKMYAAGGDNALYDGLRGENDFRTGGWQGYDSVNVDVVVDLGAVMPIKKLSIGFLQDINSWIFMPYEVEYFTSDDETNWKSVGIVKNDVPQDKWGAIIKEFYLPVNNLKNRYIRVVGKNIFHCPVGHKGYGYNAHVFADEVIVE